MNLRFLKFLSVAHNRTVHSTRKNRRLQLGLNAFAFFANAVNLAVIVVPGMKDFGDLFSTVLYLAVMALMAQLFACAWVWNLNPRTNDAIFDRYYS